MCGIAGWFGDRPRVEDHRTIEAIVASQRHRGPDNEAITEMHGEGAAAIFGHNRLSIIDLSDAANQPMWDGGREVCVAFNGEIYNYIEIRAELEQHGHLFRTQSDTEVILEAFKRWQGDAFNRLNGMFAIALFERSAGRLWLVRDRFGVKPLYYTTLGEGLLFASTPGPLARQVGAGPDLDYVARGLQYWVYEDDTAMSPYTGICAIPAGHLVVVESGARGPSVRLTRWYDYGARVAEREERIAETDDDALLEEFTSTLEDAVAIRLRSDVRVGITLSGGLDSTTIATIAAGIDSNLIAFSYGSPTDPESEGRLVAETTDLLGLETRYVAPSELNADAFMGSLEAQDAPFPDLSVTAQYLVFNEARDSGMKVILGGQGSDETLLGYRKFQLMLLRDAVRERKGRDLVRLSAGFSLMMLAESRRFGGMVRERERYLRRSGLRPSLQIPVSQEMALAGDGRESARSRQIRDVTKLSLPTLLRYEDRNSMGNSLETRLPFLDFRLAELAGALPDRLRVHRGYGKWILRRAMAGRLPPEITRARYKRGFDVARDQIARSGIGETIRERLHAENGAVRAWLPPDTVLDDLFSDRRLATSPTAFTEATSLLWLARRT